MRVLVTGGAGFIGSHLVDRLLAEGGEVCVLDSLVEQVHGGAWPGYLDGRARRVEGDVRDRDAVRAALRGADRVVHLAAAVGVAQSMYELERYVSANAVGAAVLLEELLGARDGLRKLVVASSNTIYGEGLYRCPAEGVEQAPERRPEPQLARRAWEVRCPSCEAELEPVPTPERKPLAPASVYAITKRDHEELALAWGAAYGVPVTALRFFSVYGPRQALSNPYTGVAAIFASRLLNGRRPVVFEDGRQSRDFVHVSDVVDAIVRALEPGAADGRAVNVGTGVPTSVAEVAAVLARRLEVAVEPELPGRFRAGDVRHCHADRALARELLGWEPSVPFEAGVGELADWLARGHTPDAGDRATEELAERGLTR